MTTDQLSGLALMKINKDYCEKINVDDLVMIFHNSTHVEWNI